MRSIANEVDFRAIDELDRRVAMAALADEGPVARPKLAWLYRRALDAYMATADELGIVSILEPRYDLTRDLQLGYSPAGCVIDTVTGSLKQPPDGAIRLLEQTRHHPRLALYVLDVIEGATQELLVLEAQPEVVGT